MALQDAPSLEEFKDGYKKLPDPGKGKQRARVLIGIIAVLILILAGVRFMQTLQSTRTGTITGNAVDEAGDPIQVEVLVFDTNIHTVSDENGYFIVENIPAGEQAVIIAYDVIATEVVVEVSPSIENMLGMVTVPTEELRFFE